MNFWGIIFEKPTKTPNENSIKSITFEIFQKSLKFS